MNARTLVRQTLFLSVSHLVVRVIGFLLRIWLSRSLGAQAMGLVELAQSAQMLLITPVVSGLPAAVSRMCARAKPGQQARILRCGMGLALGTGLPLAALAFVFRAQLGLWLGDLRTLPALLLFLPCIPILGISCALNGYAYGTGHPVPPALSELLEQLVRLLLCMRLVKALSGWPVMLRAAIPAAASLAGETVSLLLMLALLGRAVLFERGAGSRRAILRELLALSLPLTGMKLTTSLMRTVQATLIPARLRIAGIPAQDALARFGMFSGMLMPVLLLPSFITCSLCMVAAPELSRRQADGRPQRQLVHRLLAGTLLVGLCAMAAVWLFAPVIALRFYRQAELLPLLRRCCLLVPVMALSQVTAGLMNGLGRQSASLRIALAAGLVSVLLTYGLCALPALGLWGAVIALAAAQLLTLALSLRTLLAAVR